MKEEHTRQREQQVRCPRGISVPGWRVAWAERESYRDGVREDGKGRACKLSNEFSFYSEWDGESWERLNREVTWSGLYSESRITQLLCWEYAMGGKRRGRNRAIPEIAHLRDEDTGDEERWWAMVRFWVSLEELTRDKASGRGRGGNQELSFRR